ncbi:MAG: DUF255 domain-containing protein [Bacillota bacterium]
MKGKFRFSPRPNRAHEINWRPWGDEAFAVALVEDKPVFLTIGAPWCRGCHLMDETSFSDPEVIGLLNEKYIPVRVDADRRPDVNERYHRGGWPSNAVLTPRGRVITGGTYVPPERLKQVLEEIAGVWHDKREEFRRAEAKLTKEPPEIIPAETLDLSPYHRTVAAIKRAYDPIHYGFGRDAKFPFPQALELALHAAHTGRDEALLKIATGSLTAMAGGGMYDVEEGGFFRYCSTRDWTLPQHEKLLGVNAAMLHVCLRAFQLTGEQRFADTARDVLAYLEKHLLNPDGTWAGSQAADGEYYNLTYAERRRRGGPSVDRTVFTDQNAVLISALALAAWVLEEDQWQAKAVKTATKLWEHAYREGRGMAHYFDAEAAGLFGRLADQAAFGRACIDLYSSTGETVWLARSRTLAEFCLNELRSAKGALYDGKPDPGAIGEMAVPLANIGENGLAARWLLELGVLSGNEGYTSAANAALRALAPVFEREGLAGAAFALAVWEALHPWTCVTVVGKRQDRRTASLHHRALAAYVPAKTVRLIPAEDPPALKAAGLKLRKDPYAVVCRGTTCFHPVSEPAALIQLLRPDSA